MSYFPEGKSVWEFGTNDNALEKFKSDIDKRHCEPLGVEVNKTTFGNCNLLFLKMSRVQDAQLIRATILALAEDMVLQESCFDF